MLSNVDQSLFHWEQLKLRLQQNQDSKIAVLSVQSLDNKKMALGPEDLFSYAQQNPGVQLHGDRHTGFAMALALKAPFVVVRTQKNRSESNELLQHYISDNALIVVTGHGSAGGEDVSGNYEELGDSDLFKQIKRGPEDIVSTAMDAGLKSGNQITLLLCICYGALETRHSDSFAHQLVLEFAAHGISSTIIASNKPVRRFGANAILDGKITFNEQRGMAAESVVVFRAKVDGPNLSPIVTSFAPNETVQLTNQGIRFINTDKPLVFLTQQKIVKQQSEDEQLLAIKVQFMSLEDKLHTQKDAKTSLPSKTNKSSLPNNNDPLPDLVWPTRTTNNNQPQDCGKPQINTNKSNNATDLPPLDFNKHNKKT